MRNDVLNKLKIPAIGLITTGGINLLLSILSLLSGLVRLAGISSENSSFSNNAEKAGFIFGTILAYGIAFFSLILAPVIIYGAMQMLKGQNRRYALAASVLAILPLTSCCFVVGAIFGIWALVVLMKPEVKEYFEIGGNQPNFYPPQPPPF